MFQLANTTLEELNLRNGFAASKAGAFVSFEGWVRNENNGKKVVGLEYEAFEKLCQSEAEKIFKEVKARFDILEAKCFHRVGKLQLGEMAVWVGVTAGHRDEAFKACRYIIDQIKYRLPIWKKEYYESGDSGWVNCEPQHTVSSS